MEKLFFLFLIICFVGCAGNESLIEGWLPDATYENEWVYLVPVKDASSKTVDSTLIRESRFQFKLKPKKQNRIYILRLRPALRFELQDILVISEPGTVTVNLNKNSSASGTPLNQTLQQWKEKKREYDSTYYSLRRQFNNETGELEKVRFQSEIEKITKKYQFYMDSLAEQNKDNPAGQFFRSLTKDE